MFFARRFTEDGCQGRMIEGKPAFAFDRIHEDEFAGFAGQIVAIPEAAIVHQPMRCYTILKNLFARQVGQLA